MRPHSELAVPRCATTAGAIPRETVAIPMPLQSRHVAAKVAPALMTLQARERVIIRAARESGIKGGRR